QKGLGQVDRRDLTPADPRSELGGGQEQDVFAEAHRMRRGAMGRNRNAGSLPGSSGKSRSVLSCLASAPFCSAMPFSTTTLRVGAGDGDGARRIVTALAGAATPRTPPARSVMKRRRERRDAAARRDLGLPPEGVRGMGPPPSRLRRAP